MICNTAVLIFCLFLMCFGIANGSKCYAAEFSDDAWSCPDFDNQILQCDPLQVGMIEGKEAELGLNGFIKVLKPIEQGAQMTVEIFKILDIGKEFLYRMQGDICGNLENPDTPWYPMVSSMKITTCPIEPKTYAIKDMRLDLNSSKDAITHEMCGEYALHLAIEQSLEVLSCWEMDVTLSEYDCE